MTPQKKSPQKNLTQIYTDGSCLGNPGIGGWGAIIQHNDGEKILQGGSNATTNNRMEMTAIIAALAWTEKNIRNPHHIKIFSDSNLIIQSLLQNWKRKKNIDLWEELDSIIETLKKNNCEIEWCWVKGHSTNLHNNRVDKIAVSESLKRKRRS